MMMMMMIMMEPRVCSLHARNIYKCASPSVSPSLRPSVHQHNSAAFLCNILCRCFDTAVKTDVDVGDVAALPLLSSPLCCRGGRSGVFGSFFAISAPRRNLSQANPLSSAPLRRPTMGGGQADLASCVGDFETRTNATPVSMHLRDLGVGSQTETAVDDDDVMSSPY